MPRSWRSIVSPVERLSIDVSCLIANRLAHVLLLQERDTLSIDDTTRLSSRARHCLSLPSCETSTYRRQLVRQLTDLLFQKALDQVQLFVLCREPLHVHAPKVNARAAMLCEPRCELEIQVPTSTGQSLSRRGTTWTLRSESPSIEKLSSSAPCRCL